MEGSPIQENETQLEATISKPTDQIAMDHQNNNTIEDFAAPIDPVAPAPTSLPINPTLVEMNTAANLDAPPQQQQAVNPFTMEVPTQQQNNPPSTLDPAPPPPDHTDSAFISPFEIAPPPTGDMANFSKPPQLSGQYSQPRNSSLDSQGSASRRHHLLRHTLPPESIGDHAVHHFRVSTVPDALRAVQKMSQRDLQQAFERVYNVKSSSNNNNWLRKKLVEALVPRDGPVIQDTEINAILDEIMSKGPASKKRGKEAADGVVASSGTGLASAPPPSFPPQKQRKQSVVRPSPLDTYPGYHQPEDYPAPQEQATLTAGGRQKRRAAAGVAAATAAVLRDPALEEIEKADLQRAASGEYQDRRYGTGNAATMNASARGGRNNNHSGPNGNGATRYHNNALYREGEGGGAEHQQQNQQQQNQQQSIASALQTLSHLLSIAVRQGKVSPPLAGAGGSMNNTLNSNSVAAGGWSGQQYIQNLQQQQQQQQHYYQQQPAAAAPRLPQASGNNPYAALQQYAASAGLAGGAAAGGNGNGDPRAQLIEALTSGVFGSFGGQMAQQKQQQQQRASSTTAAALALAAAAQRASGGGSGAGGGQQEALKRLVASLGQQQQQAPAPVAQPQPQRPADPLMSLPASASKQSASELLHRALAAHVAAHHEKLSQGGGQAEVPKPEPSAAPAAPAAAPTLASGVTPSPPLPSTIPGSNFPMDAILMQLLQQQADAQKPTEAAAAATAAAPASEEDTKQ